MAGRGTAGTTGFVHTHKRRVLPAERLLAFRHVTADHDALLIINDRVDIALASDAGGVHLGQDDLPPEAARHLAPDLIIGCSAHSLDEALKAQHAGATYVNIGPICSTHTKSIPTGALGPEAIERISPHLHVPWTVMGGIKLSNVDLVLDRGARRVAVVTAVTAAEDVRAAAGLRERVVRFSR